MTDKQLKAATADALGEWPQRVASRLLSKELLRSDSVELLLFLPVAPAHDSKHEINREREMNFLQMVRIVLWSFFGVRNSASHESDIANVNFSFLPFVAILLAACIGAAIFGVVLLVTHGVTVPTQGF